MDPIALIESIKKHGVTGILCLSLFWMNSRLSDVEERLYDCLDERAQAKSAPVSTTKHHTKDIMVAILPDKLKIKWRS